MDWIDLAEGTDKWRDLLKEIMKYWVLSLRGISLLAVHLSACKKFSYLKVLT
jgi:hypothetical protein